MVTVPPALTTALILAPALFLAGCRQHTPAQSNTEPAGSAAATAPVDPTHAGEIRGVVRFNGKAPARVSIDMSMDPACSLLGGENLSEPLVAKDGKLANVFLYLKNAPASKARADTPAVVLDQKGCRFLPHVLALQQGGTVEFRNSDPTMHNIHTTPAAAGNKTVDVSQGPRGAAETQRFNTPETMLPVRCNNHPWMNAFLNVAPSPYFAVSEADGSFTIQNVPAGSYTLAAVHEKLGEQDTEIRVTAQQTQNADIAFAVSHSR